MARLLLLGPIDLTVADRSCPLGPPRQRALLGLLALAAGRIVSTTHAIEAMWGDEPPPSAVNAVQVYVNGLRKALLGAGLSTVLVTQSPGYRLLLPAGATDLEQFDALATVSDRSETVTDRAAALRTAISLWRGPLLSDIDAPYVEAVRAHWAERYAAARLDWQRAELALGRHDELVAVLESDVRADPYREAIWRLLALALYRGGRQHDALTALRRLRRLLANELGIDPSAEITDLEQQILSQSPELESPARRPGGELQLGSLRTHVASSSDAGGDETVLLLPDGRRVVIGSAPVVLGRHESCDVVISSQQVSRQHARLVRAAGGHEVVDLGSTNGTTVNGSPVGDDGAVLSDGDALGLGRVTLTFRTNFP